MKIFITYIFALYFLLAGTGYNLINYCCLSCAEIGIEDVDDMSCHTDDIEEASCCCETAASEEQSSTCKAETDDSESCNLTRLKTDIPTKQIQKTEFKLPVISIFYALESIFLTHLYADNFATYYIDPPNETLHKGRIILLNKSVLII